MAVRDGPMIPMTTSGHCAFGPDHTKCHKVGCTCSCHIIPDFLEGVRESIDEDRTTRRKIHRTRRKLL